MKGATTKHYAKAIAGLSDDQAVFDQLIADLVDVHEKLDEALDLKQYLVDPHVSLTKKKEALKTVFQDFISERTYNVLYLLIKNKKLGYLSDVISQAKKEQLSKDDVAEVVIESVIPVTPGQQEKIKTIIADKLQKNVIVRNHINNNLIGGLRLTIGDIVLDGSLTGRLDRLQQQIAEL
jgi:F-type H+-transporting ATPase subunit delta